MSKHILFPKAVIKEAQAQYEQGSSFKQFIVAKFFNPVGSGTWWLMNMEQDEDPDYCWGFAEISDFEMGSFSKSELESFSMFGLGIERDLHFTPIPAWKLWEEKTGLTSSEEEEEEEVADET